VQQKPIEGVSMLYSFNDSKAAERHETQYFEMFGNRGIYHKGWTAVTRHKTPWILIGEKVLAFDDDLWELYDTTKDWSQANNLAKEMPEKLRELQRLWLIEAVRYNVLPLVQHSWEDRVSAKADARTARRTLGEIWCADVCCRTYKFLVLHFGRYLVAIFVGSGASTRTSAPSRKVSVGFGLAGLKLRPELVVFLRGDDIRLEQLLPPLESAFREAEFCLGLLQRGLYLAKLLVDFGRFDFRKNLAGLDVFTGLVGHHSLTPMLRSKADPDSAGHGI